MSGAKLPNRGERSVAALPGGAKPIAGRVALEGFTPPHRFKARTAASDGHCAFTRAARSAGLRFAVRSLSETIDRGIAAQNAPRRGAGVQVTSSTAERSPFPSMGRTIARFNLGVTASVGHPRLSQASSTAERSPFPEKTVRS